MIPSIAEMVEKNAELLGDDVLTEWEIGFVESVRSLVISYGTEKLTSKQVDIIEEIYLKKAKIIGDDYDS